MTTTQPSEYRNDNFAFWGTEVLIGICYRVTPRGELGNWVVTSAARYADAEGTVEQYDQDALRAFAVEQLEEYGITEGDINNMKS